MSAAVVGACGARISGAMYSGVPIAPVTWEEATVSQMRATPKSASFGVQVWAAPTTRVAARASGTVAAERSTLRRPPPGGGAGAEAAGGAGAGRPCGPQSMRTLAGLRSRWTIPASCTAASPRAMSAPIRHSSPGRRGPEEASSPRRSPPSTKSMTIAKLVPSMTMSRTPTT